MNTYWQQKKVMAPGCEPELVTHMMEALKDHVYGMSMAGAGGGGFLYILTKQPHRQKLIEDILANIPVKYFLMLNDN